MRQTATLHNNVIKPAFLVLFFCATGVCVAATAEETYHWPLDLPRELSSSFAEYRSGRFHAGIDLRTGGVIGKPVYVAADGYVSRVRCSPWGYGKAVYVQFNDGNSVVYAHLDDYFDELRGYIRRNQHAKQSYTVDLYPERGQFPVRCGQQIAMSGSTGVGPPHLHYELRDAAGRPFNPRLSGVQWPDTTRPVIRGLLIAPDGPDGTVNGGYAPATLDVTHHGSGRYTTPPVTASGRIGIGVDVFDPGDGGIRMGVHVLRLMHGESELFRVQHDYLSYDNMHNGAVSYHPFLLDKGRYLVLWRWPGNVSDLYAPSPGDGWFALPDASTELVVQAVDFMGNTAEVTIPVQPETPPSSSAAAPPAEAAPGMVVLNCYGTYITLTASFPSAETQPPELLVENGPSLNFVPFRNINDCTWTAAFKPTQNGEHTLRVTHPRIPFHEEVVQAVLRGASSHTITRGDVQITVKPDSPYGVLFAQVAPAANTSATPLRNAGGAWRIWPENMPVDTQVELSLPLPDTIESPTRAGIYRDSGGSWRYVGGKHRDNRITASIRSFGVYAVLEDNQSPTLREISPPDQYSAQTKRPILRAVINDVGSGIASFEITANGKWLLAEYVPDENKLAWERDEDLPTGEHEIIFRVTDNAGNTTTARRVVYIP